MDYDETYRERWLACFLATYSLIGALAGLMVAVGAIIQTDNNRALIAVVGAVAVTDIFLILLLFGILRRMYDLLGFTINPSNQQELAEYKTKGNRYADWAKTRRKLYECAIHCLLLAQTLFLIIAWYVR